MKARDPLTPLEGNIQISSVLNEPCRISLKRSPTSVNDLKRLKRPLGAVKMSAIETEAGGFKRTLKDLFAGAAGGVAQVLLGQ